jgi:hypothetical protein
MTGQYGSGTQTVRELAEHDGDEIAFWQPVVTDTTSNCPNSADGRAFRPYDDEKADRRPFVKMVLFL